MGKRFASFREHWSHVVESRLRFFGGKLSALGDDIGTTIFAAADLLDRASGEH